MANAGSLPGQNAPIYAPAPQFNSFDNFRQLEMMRRERQEAIRRDSTGMALPWYIKQELLDSARANINLLKQNTLVVRLRTGSNKIKALETILANPDLGKWKHRRHQRMLEDTKKEVQLENELLMEAFKQHYTFSKLMWMPDTAATALKSGARRGIFLNDELALDTSLVLEGSYFVAYVATGDADSRQPNVDGLHIVDKNYKPLIYPFPSFIGRAWILRVAFGEELHYERLVKRFNKTMEIN